MPGPLAALFLLQTEFWNLVSHGTILANSVLAILLAASVFSWTIIFSKWSAFGRASRNDAGFLRAFRQSGSIEGAIAAGEQFGPSPLVSLFRHGYREVSRQMKSRGQLSNPDALSRSLQLGTSEQLSQLEQHLNWLATTAAVSPFIGLLGTVLGIIRAFQNLGSAGSTSLSAVGPGIAEALIATAVGLFAAIPAAVFYNHFGHMLKKAGEQMDDFGLEFLNLIERSFGE